MKSQPKKSWTIAGRVLSFISAVLVTTNVAATGGSGKGGHYTARLTPRIKLGNVEAVGVSDPGPQSGEMLPDVVMNGGFEHVGEGRPPYWFVGFQDEPLPSEAGTWALDETVFQSGQRSLRLEPQSEGIFVSQILHAPTFDLQGKHVTVSGYIRTDALDGSALLVVLAINPERTPDPDFGVGLVGKTILQATGPDGHFARYDGQFTADGPAQALVVLSVASGTAGRAWFDDIAVELDVTAPGPGPDPATVPMPFAEGSPRFFWLGVTNEAGIDLSEVAVADLVEKATQVAEVLNVFFHVGWGALRGTPILDDHERQLAAVDSAKARGMKLMLTLDFTHNSPDGVGDINPMPDGTPVGPLSDPAVQDAYVAELLALFERVQPVIVSVGIETDIFYQRHPQSWDDFVTLYAKSYDAIKQRRPSTHVTTYFTLPFLVRNDATLTEAHVNVVRQLMPRLNSLAYSIYPSFDGRHPQDLPPGYFTRIRDIDTSLPILIPEFGHRSDIMGSFSDEEQAEVLYRVLEEVGPTHPVLISWYGLHDQLYLGAPEWFRTAFENLGLIRLDGTPKRSWVLFQKVKSLPLLATAVDEGQPPPIGFALLQNYPNPFNPETTIRYRVARTAQVTLEVYNLLGQKIETLVSATQPAGEYGVRWQPAGLAPGVYLYQLRVGNALLMTRKTILLK